MRISLWLRSLRVALLLVLCLLAQSAESRAQSPKRLGSKTPLARGSTLILGIQGFVDGWDNTNTGVGRIAVSLREKQVSGVSVETIENGNRELALEFVRRALDQNEDGRLDPEEVTSVRVIVYGHSFGGAAAVKLARELEPLGVPLALLIGVDSIGRNDARIPPNVRRAANFCQRNGIFLRGEKEFHAEDSNRTEILGNFEYDYSRRKVNMAGASWYKRYLFRSAHAKMEYDPEVWGKVEELILHEVSATETGASPANQP